MFKKLSSFIISYVFVITNVFAGLPSIANYSNISNNDSFLENLTHVSDQKTQEKRSPSSLKSGPIDDLDLIGTSDFDQQDEESQTDLPQIDELNSSSSRVSSRLRGNLIKLAIASGTLVLVFANDEEIHDFVQDNRSDVTEVAAYAGELFGSELPVYAAGAGYIIGLVMKDDKIKKTSILLAKSLLITGLIAQGLKRSFHRERPGEDHGAYEFHGPNLIEGDHLSFPSGHTTTAFAFATFIAEYTKHKSKVIPVLAYTAAAIGGWSRMHDNKHWASDVLVGAVIGHLVTKYIIKKHTQKSGISISPGFGTDGSMMVKFTYSGRHKDYVQTSSEDDNNNEFLFNEFE